MDNSQQPTENLGQSDQLELMQLPDQPNSIQPIEPRTREYLSNERTYLSWMRTAISLMGIGVLLGRIHVARLALAPSPSTIWQLGLIFAVVGLIIVFLATQHYLAVRREIANDSNEATDRWVIVLSIVVILMGSGILYYVLAYTPNYANS